MSTPRTRGQRAGLTRQDVLTTAQQLISESGLDGLTMRSLARRLDVAPNALYSYVPNKTALIDGLLDEALATVDAPPPEAGTPADGLSAIMTSTYEVLLAHVDLVPLYLARQGARGPNARRLGDIMLSLLSAAGITDAAAHEAVRVLIVYTIGFAALATPPSLAVTSADTEVAGPHSETTPAGLPLSADELSANFATGLRWLLDGILAPTSR
ncbi:TetR/AcrR family transcriptional regulator [Phytoactinopolyspora mesophila]|uniref:TetR family transcriptional regulator n=1 Tax=Phytoactinopolyspora mesophila TaxID=2650750 RepID=A0A7K3M3N4_9ACTN|nr:TetR/AcrR family transcriptional regulator [Phytoactinopolyspora mesophila]NDL57830.1 TetR family transcriptional regulator [Phytoactinopolyspora mesophila]